MNSPAVTLEPRLVCSPSTWKCWERSIVTAVHLTKLQTQKPTLISSYKDKGVFLPSVFLFLLVSEEEEKNLQLFQEHAE
eukprot:m.5097 g.5097  ORF g.5097 m.5097 type:complete len:79 (+) comp5308_c0_seq1:781-1017(+)